MTTVRHPSKESLSIEAERWLRQELAKQPRLEWIYSTQPETQLFIRDLWYRGYLSPPRVLKSQTYYVIEPAARALLEPKKEDRSIMERTCERCSE